MFTRLLIANRGEIAVRIARTARRMGLQAIGVYSEAEAGALHVRSCDTALCIGGPRPQDSYLRGDRIIAAALAAGAQAVHPGYGFLAENAEFAAACVRAGLIFIGPSAEAIRAMGSKSAAKELMRQAGVPLLPGYHGDNQETDYLLQQAVRIGFPVLIKAVAGGGGRGMRRVDRPEEFAVALASCQREAQSGFNDARVLLEKYLDPARHIEVQVFGDQHGHALHLFERDCSVQRRHQKVVEEAPAPGMTAGRRQAMGDAAVAAARAVNYSGAGTVEFIVDASGDFYFMEMNTRLQVEHPVTEMITGLDLVEWQLRVAAGEPLPCRQQDLRLRGHAIEARLYSEDPARGFLPATGTLHRFRLPDTHDRLRVDAAFEQGDVVTPYYDSLLAKLVVRGDSREEAVARLAEALSGVEIVGTASNVEFLARLASSPSFASARLDTHLIERERDHLFPPPAPPAETVWAQAARAWWQVRIPPASAGDNSAWSRTDGWRLGGVRSPRPLRVLWQDLAREVRVWPLDPPEHPRLRMVVAGTQVHVFEGASHQVFTIEDPYLPPLTVALMAGGLTAPMPGRVVAVPVAVGQRVVRGQALVVLEAMKMEHTLTAPRDGAVARVNCAAGEQVREGAELLVLE